jgi:hypothetical protein
MSGQNLIYEPVFPRDRAELEKLLRSFDWSDVADALYSASRYESDWHWVQGECLKRLSDPVVSVRWAAATCLGDLAFRRFPLDKELVIRALEKASLDLEIADPSLFSLGMVKEFVYAD